MNRTAIITGAGMDAKTLAHFLLSKDYNVILTYRRNTVLDINHVLSLFQDDLLIYPNAKIEAVLMDITDKNSIDKVIYYVKNKYERIDELYHLAAQSHVGESFKIEELSISTNGLSAFYILDSLRKYSKETKFYFANTSECFGGNPDNCPFNEDSVQELRSPYSLGKNLGANITKYFRQTYDMYACFGWLFNHSNIYRHDSFFFMKIIRAAAKISLNKQKELFLGSLNFWRDEHLSDFGCEMMWKMLNNPKGPIDYVIGNGNANFSEEYLDCAFSYFNLNWRHHIKLDKTLLRPNDVIKLVADPSRAISDLGWIKNRINLKQHIDIVSKYVYQQETGQHPERVDVFKLFP